MQEWWMGLSGAVRFFYGMAAFFSVFFVWQIFAAFLGLSGDDMELDSNAGVDISDLDTTPDAGANDVIEASQAFKILSLRSIITFFTLFSWGSALYLQDGIPLVKAMAYASVWGVAGMVAIAFIFWGMGKLTETGTKNVADCLGALGTVYLDIPANGFGEIKTTVGGVAEHVKARSATGESLRAGTQVRVVQVVGQAWVGVEKMDNKGESK